MLLAAISNRCNSGRDGKRPIPRGVAVMIMLSRRRGAKRMGRGRKRKKKKKPEVSVHSEPLAAASRPPAQRPVVRPTAVDYVNRLGPLLTVFPVALAGLLAFRRLGDADTWFHLAAGRWIVENLAVPHTDTLSYTVPDHPWINVQWLFDVFIYGLHRAGGPSFVVFAGAALFMAGMVVLLKNLRLAIGPVASTLIALWGLAVAQARFNVRPEMISLLLLQIVLLVCVTGWRNGARRLWLLPVIMLVWVNTHSLFVIGAFVIVCYMAATLVCGLPFMPRGFRESVTPAARRTMILAGTAALLVTLANPYGLDGVMFPLKLMTRVSGEVPLFQRVGELRPSFS